MPHDSSNRNNAIGISFALLTVLIWSGNFIVARAVYKEIPPISLAFYRWLLATLLFLPFSIRAFLREWGSIKRSAGYFLAVALTGVAMFNTFVYIGAHYTSAINLTLIGTTSSPVIAVVLAYFFLKEKIGWLKICGMTLCVTGILYLLSKGNYQNLLSLHFTPGDSWVLLAALAFAVYTILVKKKPVAISTPSFLFAAFSLGTLMLLPFYTWEINHTAPVVWNSKLIFSIFYLGLGASVICFPAWNIAIHKLGAARTALFGNLILIFSSLEAVIILHEQFSWIHIVSAVLVFAGIILSNLHVSR